ncbi:MAG: MDR family oxidoreductase [Hyphomicrobiales bacterium]|nr:MDR family oxidoreductase [Hyphomicrobiales bacterium]
MDDFDALVLEKADSGHTAGWKRLTHADLMEGDVLVRVSHSTINYKDGLALTGRAPVVRRWPMIPGIDFSGVVEESSSPEFKAGDAVVLNGWGLGETHLGGYAQYARVKSDWLVPLPQAFTPAQAMAIGTAGYTAMLAILALEQNGSAPDKGPVLVTGAAGGVGSVAVALLAKLGYRVLASTGRPEEEQYLKSLGAAEIVNRDELSQPSPNAGRSLAKERWAAAIDVAGSHTLANAIAQTGYGGAVAACGLAQGIDLTTSVAPFILRGVSLYGIDSVRAPKPKRLAAWSRLAADLDQDKLDAMTVTRPVRDVEALAPEILAGKVRGRVVLEVG